MDNEELIEQKIRDIIKPYEYMPFGCGIEKWDIEKRLYYSVVNYLKSIDLDREYDVNVYINAKNIGYVDIQRKRSYIFIEGKLKL